MEWIIITDNKKRKNIYSFDSYQAFDEAIDRCCFRHKNQQIQIQYDYAKSLDTMIAVLSFS